jgi:hypothetical protein
VVVGVVVYAHEHVDYFLYLAARSPQLAKQTVDVLDHFLVEALVRQRRVRLLVLVNGL